MGIRGQLSGFEKEALKLFKLKYAGLEWCELGCQMNRVRHRPAKQVYEELGVKHTSIDLAGFWGSLPLDLDYPMPEELLNRFDVVTNYGTIEHVNNQYQVFKNVHEMCKQNGIMIHGLPREGSYAGHCRYYYNEDFVNSLSEKCGYTVHNMRVFAMGPKKRLLSVVFKKQLDNDFITAEEFKNIPLVDTGDTSHTGDYIVKYYERRRNHRPE